MDRKYHFGFIIILILYFLPYFILGENFPLDVFDNMNSNIVWNKLAIEYWPLLFSPTSEIPNILGGKVPFSSIYSNIDIATFFLASFGYYWGYIVNKIIMSLLGYWGVFKLLRSYFKIENKTILWLLAVSFALIPFWGFSIHVVGLPLLFHVFYRIYNGSSNKLHWLYLVIFSFYSNLVLIGLFVLAICFYILVITYLRTKKVHWTFFWSTFLLSISYLASNFPLIYSFLFSENYISHRTEMVIYDMNFKDTMTYLWDIIFKGSFVYHGQKFFFHSLYFIPVLFGCIFMWFKKESKPFVKHLWLYYFVSHLLLIITTWKPTVTFFNDIFKKIPIALDRFLWFIPLFWIVLIAVVADYAIKKNKNWTYPFYLLIIFQTGIIVSNHKYFVNKDQPSFTEYYSTDLFKEVKNLIGKEQETYRVMNIGMEPAISQYNGFYTLGGFSANYPLEYKHQIYKIIKNELLKENGWSLRIKFEFWGSMCYFFSQDFGRRFGKEHWKPINDLDYNWDYAKSMGAEYVFSPIKLNLENITQLRLIKSFNAKKYYYPLNVYKIK